MKLLLCKKTVLKIIPGFFFCLKLKIIFTSFILRHKGGCPPELMLQPLFVADFFPFSSPLFFSAQNTCIKRVSIMYEDPFDVITGFYIHDQLVFIVRIAHLL